MCFFLHGWWRWTFISLWTCVSGHWWWRWSPAASPEMNVRNTAGASESDGENCQEELSRHRLGDTEVSGQTRVFYWQRLRSNQEVTRGEWSTMWQGPDSLACSDCNCGLLQESGSGWSGGETGTSEVRKHTGKYKGVWLGLGMWTVDRTRRECGECTDIVELD